MTTPKEPMTTELQAALECMKQNAPWGFSDDGPQEQEEHKVHMKALTLIKQALEDYAEVNWSRSVVECLVDYVREHLADHLVALGETTEKNRRKASDMRFAIAKAEDVLDCREAKEKA